MAAHCPGGAGDGRRQPHLVLLRRRPGTGDAALRGSVRCAPLERVRGALPRLSQGPGHALLHDLEPAPARRGALHAARPRRAALGTGAGALPALDHAAPGRRPPAGRAPGDRRPRCARSRNGVRVPEVLRPGSYLAGAARAGPSHRDGRHRRSARRVSLHVRAAPGGAACPAGRHHLLRRPRARRGAAAGGHRGLVAAPRLAAGDGRPLRAGRVADAAADAAASGGRPRHSARGLRRRLVPPRHRLLAAAGRGVGGAGGRHPARGTGGGRHRRPPALAAAGTLLLPAEPAAVPRLPGSRTARRLRPLLPPARAHHSAPVQPAPRLVRQDPHPRRAATARPVAAHWRAWDDSHRPPPTAGATEPDPAAGSGADAGEGAVRGSTGATRGVRWP